MKTALLINNDYSYLITDDKKIISILWEKLRFRKRNYYHNRAYRQKRWDGYIDFFNKTNGRFLSGLLPEVEAALNFFKIPYEKIDQREKIEFGIDKIDEKYLADITPRDIYPKDVTLQDYQVDFVNKAIKWKRGIVEAPTASGKTLILVSMLKALPKNLPTLFLCNKKSIIQQNYEEIKAWGFDNVGRFNSDAHEPNVITCANVQSIHHLEKHLHKFKALFVDEVHLMMSDSCIKVYKKMKGSYIRVGLSATPFKYAESDKVHKFSVKGFFGPVLKIDSTKSGKLTVGDLQKTGRLSKSVCHFYYIRTPDLPYEIYQDAVTKGIAQNFEFHQIIKRLSQKLIGRTLIIVERLAHGDALHNLIPNSLWVQGKDNNDTRKQVIEQLQKSENVVAIATSGIFDAGINVFVHNLINAAGGSAAHNIKQRMGRGLRIADDKEILNYYDFIFTINPYLEKHSKQRIKVLKDDKHEIIIYDKIDF